MRVLFVLVTASCVLPSAVPRLTGLRLLVGLVVQVGRCSRCRPRHLVDGHAHVGGDPEAQDAQVDGAADAAVVTSVVVVVGLPSSVERVVVRGAGKVDRHAVVGVGRL